MIVKHPVSNSETKQYFFTFLVPNEMPLSLQVTTLMSKVLRRSKYCSVLWSNSVDRLISILNVIFCTSYVRACDSRHP